MNNHKDGSCVALNSSIPVKAPSLDIAENMKCNFYVNVMTNF